MLRTQWFGRTGVALACVAGVAAGREARADGIPIIVLTTTTAPQGEATTRLARINAALSGNAQVGPALAQQIRERYGRREPTSNTLADATARINAARAAYNNAAASNDSTAMDSAIESLERIASEFEAQPDILSTFSDAREQLARTLLFIADTTIQSAPARADDAIRRLAVIDPQRVITARAASSAVRQAFLQRVQQIATAGLVVNSATPGCEVFRDGRSVGNAPAQLSNLAPGSHHRISLRCGGRTSLIHPVNVAAGSTSSITIDVQLDSALDVLSEPSLRYASVETGRERWNTDLARIGTSLGATRIFGLIPSEDRVVAIDVVSGALVGTSPVTDGAQLRRLALGPVTGSVSSHTSNNGNGGSELHHGHGGGGRDPRPGETHLGNGTRVGVNVGPQREQPPPQYREESHEVRGGVPAGAFVLGGLGVAGIATGVVFSGLSQGSYNRALQNGESSSDSVRDRQQRLGDAATLNYVAIGSYALGGVLIVSGALYGIFGRSTTTVTERVRVSAAPTRDGAMLTIGGAL